MTHRILAILFIGLALTACTTRVDHRIAVPESIKAGVTVETITASTAPGVDAAAGGRLVDALREALAEHQVGPRAVDLKLHIKTLKIVDSATRMFVGMFAGANQMIVAVQVLDASGAVIADFDVDREANPGGYGAFYDQEEATIREVAKAIASSLQGETT